MPSSSSRPAGARSSLKNLALGALPLVLFATPFACGKSSEPATGSTPIEDASVRDTSPVDVAALPPAQGDPCRGQPLPTDQHHVPAGMCASLVAVGPAGVRQIMFTPSGDLFAASRNSVWLLRDEDGDGYFTSTEIHEWGKTGGNGNNVHVDVAGGFVYAGTPTGVKRWPYVAGALAAEGPGEAVVTGQPAGGHSYHTTHVFDGYLYVHSGSAGNATNENANRAEYDVDRSLIRRFPLASFNGTPFQWSSGEVVTVGLRNANGFTQNATGRIYAVVNGLDDQRYANVDVHNDNPGEQIVEIAPGKKYGYPFCFTAQRVVVNGALVASGGKQLVNAGFGEHDDAWCEANSERPAAFVQAHSAPLDIVFFDNQPRGALPDNYRGGAFVALHGSWNRGPATGYKVVWVPFDAEGKSPVPTSTVTDTTFPYVTIFGGGDASGPKDGAWAWDANGKGEGPRPAGVAISPIDGALYITSDEGAGMIYRVGVKR